MASRNWSVCLLRSYACGTSYHLSGAVPVTLVPLVIATLCYVWAGVALAMQGQPALSTAYVAYAVANVGLIIIALGGK